MSVDRPALVVAGPTASGKSALAMDAAEALRGVVINADSMQVYRELRILTARPSPAEEARVPHRLYGVLSAGERCSAGRWRDMALGEIAAAHGDGALPVVVGGTGLYLQALTSGLAHVPPIPEGVRAEARALFERLGGEAFRAALAEHDSRSAARLPASDRQRLLRAWEVVRATGRPLPDWQRETATAGGLDIATIAIVPPREALYTAAEARFERMLADGAVEEVRALLALRLDPGLPAMKAVGVRELAAFVAGEATLEEAAHAAKRATRTYAKRQLTWLRHQVSADLTLNAQYSERFRDGILSFIRQFLLTGAR